MSERAAIVHELALRNGLQVAATERRLDHVLQARMTLGSFPDLESYARHLLSDDSEWTSFVEAFVVPETWFFREAAVLKELAHKAVVCRDRERPLQILSLPCSTGEEAWSIAIHLLQEGLSSSDFVVEAGDLHRGSVQRAERGVYSKNSFRGARESWQQSWFEPVGEQWRVVDKVRPCVSFKQINLVQPPSWLEQARFDFVVCRNLFVYMTSAARESALTLFSSLLHPQGVLFTSAADALTLGNTEFVLRRSAKCFWFEKRGAPPSHSEGIQPVGRMRSSSNASQKTSEDPRGIGGSRTPLKAAGESGSRGGAEGTQVRSTLRPRESGVPSLLEEASLTPLPPPSFQAGPSPGAVPDQEALNASEKQGGLATSERLAVKGSRVAQATLLGRARACADQGDLMGALELCQRVLASGTPQAEAYYLIALVASVDDRPDDAVEQVRRALYLDPRHRGALELAAVLARQRGQELQARRYELRLRREEGV